jgi:hypothetical protein
LARDFKEGRERRIGVGVVRAELSKDEIPSILWALQILSIAS